MSMHCGVFYPMIQHIILPQIGLAQDKIKNNGIQGDHSVLETPYRETNVFGSHGPQYNATSDLFGPGETKNSAIPGDHCILKTPYRETTVFGCHDPRYYTTLDWLGP